MLIRAFKPFYKPQGRIYIQPSKSYLHRQIILGALSCHRCEIHNFYQSDDIIATLDGLHTLGLCEYSIQGNTLIIDKGDGIIKGDVDCNESGSTLRFLIPIALTMDKEVTFRGKGRLLKRPQDIYIDMCNRMGFSFLQTKDYIKVKGNLKPATFTMEGNISSQFVSGLSMALSTLDGVSKIIFVNELESCGYFDITIDVLKSFLVDCKKTNNAFHITGGISPNPSVTCPGDWTAAANFACMGAFAGDVTIEGLDENSLQGDSCIVNILSEIGAEVKFENNRFSFAASSFRNIDIDARDIPDIVPVLAVCLGAGYGISKIYNIKRLSLKESNRLIATADLINAIGGYAKIGEDFILLSGAGGYNGGVVKTYNDHRMAMAAAVAATFSTGDIIIDNKSCVSKSAPDFWKDFCALGGQIKEDSHV